MIVAKKGDKGTKVRVIQRLLKVYPDGIFGYLTEEAVKEWQKAHNLTVDGIVGVETWKTLLVRAIQPAHRNITEIIVHCTATPAGKDYTVTDIKAWHLLRGFSDIGYHYVIYRDGSIHDGRKVTIAGAHCTGHNTNSIGVCYVGGLGRDGKTPKDTRTYQQRVALEQLLTQLRALYPKAKIYGHRDFANKACPSFNAKKEFADI